MIKIKFAENDSEIRKCFPVMRELRIHLNSESEFLDKVKKQINASGFKLVLLENESGIKAVAGIRILENLAWGKFLYIDDLVTLESERSNGYGEKLFDWIINYAKENSCDQLHLDSGVQRFDAHRFYLKKKMYISSHHFTVKLK